MTDLVALQDRLDRMETAMAHQEQTVDDLNRMVVEQWKLIEDLTRRVRALGEQIEDYAANAAAGRPVDRPPHY